MGFAHAWVNLIMMCVKTANFAILINGSPISRIYPSRGIWQGYPISPYLFLLCAEALSTQLTKADGDGILRGVPTSRQGPRLNYLFFADDNLLFCSVDLAHWHCLSKLLNNYEEASGQRLNKEKTTIFFSRNTPMETQSKILEVSKIPISQRYDTYLGLPALVGRSRVHAFQSIKDRIWRRLQD